MNLMRRLQLRSDEREKANSGPDTQPAISKVLRASSVRVM